jgi:hypothetical protein
LQESVNLPSRLIIHKSLTATHSYPRDACICRALRPPSRPRGMETPVVWISTSSVIHILQYMHVWRAGWSRKCSVLYPTPTGWSKPAPNDRWTGRPKIRTGNTATKTLRRLHEEVSVEVVLRLIVGDPVFDDFSRWQWLDVMLRTLRIVCHGGIFSHRSMVERGLARSGQQANEHATSHLFLHVPRAAPQQRDSLQASHSVRNHMNAPRNAIIDQRSSSSDMTDFWLARRGPGSTLYETKRE